MDVRACNGCGRLYKYMGGQPYCPGCIAKMDEKFKDVKEYIYDHPNVGVKEVAEEFDINPKVIYRWVREERLCFSEQSAIGVSCQGCGVTIRSGRFCKKCKQELINGFAGALQDENSSDNLQEKMKADMKMRFLSE